MLKTVKGLAKAEIPENVKGGVVKPWRHIHLRTLTFSDDVLQLRHEQVDVFLNERLLLAKRACSKTWAENAPHIRVFFGANHAEQRIRMARLARPPQWILEKLPLTVVRARLENVCVGIRVSECNFIWGDTNDGPVALMKTSKVVDTSSTD